MSTPDYHNFVDKFTPKEERRRLNTGDIYINAATCKLCGERIRSKNRHDFVTCKCGNVSVDGGSWYVRRAFRKSAKTFINEIVHFADVEKELERDHEVKSVKCSICGKLCVAMNAHLHQGKYIGDECCWDERLRSSE